MRHGYLLILNGTSQLYPTKQSTLHIALISMINYNKQMIYKNYMSVI